MNPTPMTGPAVLIMTDEPELRRHLLRSLAESGYCVLEAPRGETGGEGNDASGRIPALSEFAGAFPSRTDQRPVVMFVSKEAGRDPVEAAGTPPRASGKREFRFGPLEIDFARRRVCVADHLVRLTRTEFAFLCILAESAGEIVTQRQIVRKLWGGDGYRKAVSVRVFACSLRRKLRGFFPPNLIQTEPGFGYRLAIAD